MLAAFCPLYLIASPNPALSSQIPKPLGCRCQPGARSKAWGGRGRVWVCRAVSAFMELGFPSPATALAPGFFPLALCFEPRWLVVMVAGGASSCARDPRCRHLLLHLGNSLVGKSPKCSAPPGAGLQLRLDLLLSRKKPVSLGSEAPLCRCAFASDREGWIYPGINWMQLQIDSAGRAMIIKIPLILN